MKLRPGGSISPFCEPATVTSTPHSSIRYSIEASEEIVSTKSSAGWRAASIASRTAGIRLTTPVEVSLCTTQTALISWPLSARKRASIAAGSAPCRQSVGRSSVLRPKRVAICSQSNANQPVSTMSTASPGDNVFTSAASQAPVPDAG